MNKLYNDAKKISNSENIKENQLILKHINMVMELFTESYDELIKYYASKYYKYCIIGFINTDYLYNNIINIEKLLYPTNLLLEKHKKYNINPLIERLINFFKPFKILILRGNDIINFFINFLKYKINISNINNNIICIILSWNE